MTIPTHVVCRNIAGHTPCSAASALSPPTQPLTTAPSPRPPLQVAGYSGLLLAAPTMLYEVIAYVVPGLTKSERKFLAPIVFGSSILFYLG